MIINSQSSLLKSGDMFDPQKCKVQIGQEYGDIFITFLEVSKEKVCITKLSRDIKIDYRGPLKGYFTFKVFVSSNYKDFVMWVNDITVTLNLLLKKPLSDASKVQLMQVLADINALKKEQKNIINLKETFNLIKDILIELTFNKNIIADNIHFSVVIDLEVNEDRQIQEIIANIENDPNLLQHANHEIQYPKKYGIYDIQWDKYNKLALQGIRLHIPKSIREDVTKNYIKTFQEFCKKK